MASQYELIMKLSADIADLKTGFAAAAGSFGELGSAAQIADAKFRQMSASLTDLGTRMSVAVTAPLLAVGGAALKVAGDFEQAKVAFTTMLGSADIAQTHLEALRDFAMKTPFQFPELVDASKRLQALGFTASQVIPALKSIGNATAALGTGALGIERISLALGQMQAKGKVSAQDMRQLAEAGIPAWQILAEAISKAEGKVVSVADIMKRSEKGFVDGTMAVQALLAGMQQRFGGLMEEQAKTLLGVWSNFKDQTTKILTDIGDALAPLAKKTLGVFTAAASEVEILVRKFRQLPEGVQTAMISLAGMAAAAGPAVFIVGQLGTAWAKLTPLLASAGTAIATLASRFEIVYRASGSLATAFEAILAPLSGLGSKVALVAEFFVAWKVGAIIGDLINLGIAAAKSGDAAAASIPQVKQAESAWDQFMHGLKGEEQGTFQQGWLEKGRVIQSFSEGVGAALRGIFTGIPRLLDMIDSGLQGFLIGMKDATTAAEAGLLRLQKAMPQPNFRDIGTPGSAVAPLRPNIAKEEDDKLRAAIQAREQAAVAAAEAAKKAQKEIEAAFKTLGLEDVSFKTREAEQAFRLLGRTGKLSGDQLALAMMNVQRETAGLTPITEKQIAAIKSKWEDFVRDIPKSFEGIQAASFNLGPAIKNAQEQLSDLFKKFELPATAKLTDLPLTEGVRKLGSEISLNIQLWKKWQDQIQAIDVAKAFEAANEAARKANEEFGREISKIGSSANLMFPEIASAIAAELDSAKKPIKEFEADLKRLGITQRQEARANVDEVIAANKRIQDDDKVTMEMKVTGWRAVFRAVSDEAAKVATAGMKGFAQLEAAMSEIGEHSAKAFEIAAEKARALFDIIAKNAASTRGDIDRAALAAMEAEAKATVARGDAITETMKRTMDRLKAVTEEGHKSMETQWDSFANGVGDAIAGIGNKAFDILISGKGSLSGVWKAALEDMRSAFTTAFVAPVQKVLNEFISQTVAALLNGLAGKGFGGVIDAASGMVDVIKSAFGIASKTTAAIASVATKAAQTTGDAVGGIVHGWEAASAATKAAAATTQAATTVIITSMTALQSAMMFLQAGAAVVSAVTGVLSYLQGRRMEQDIGRIEVTTRGQLNQLVSLQESANASWPRLAEIRDGVTSVISAIGQLGETITDRLSDLAARMERALAAGIIVSGIAIAGQPTSPVDAGGEVPNPFQETIDGAKAIAEANANATKDQGKTVVGLPAISVADIFPRITALFQDVRNLAGSIAAGNRIPGEQEFQNIRDQFKSIADQVANSVNIDFRGNKDLEAIMAKLGDEIKNLSSAAAKVPKEASGSTAARDAAKLQADEIASGYADLSRQISNSISQVTSSSGAASGSLTGLSDSSSAASASLGSLSDAASSAAQAAGGMSDSMKAAMDRFKAQYPNARIGTDDKGLPRALYGDVGADTVKRITSPGTDASGKLLPVPKVDIPVEVASGYRRIAAGMQQSTQAVDDFVKQQAADLQDTAQRAATIVQQGMRAVGETYHAVGETLMAAVDLPVATPGTGGLNAALGPQVLATIDTSAIPPMQGMAAAPAPVSNSTDFAAWYKSVGGGLATSGPVTFNVNSNDPAYLTRLLQDELRRQGVYRG